jgi:hypothetical protein
MEKEAHSKNEPKKITYNEFLSIKKDVVTELSNVFGY